MAQAGFTPIITYHSTTGSAVPSNSNLSPGELALNIADMKLYCENSSGTVTLLASAAGASGDVVGPGSATDGAIVAFDGTTGKLIKAASLGTGVATWLGTPSSANLAAAVTDETGSGALVFGTSPSISRSLLNTTKEKITVSATAATGTVNFDAITQSVLYYTTNASGNWTLNVRGDGSTTLDSIMSTGEALTVTFLVTQGATAYYQSAFQVDGNAITPEWQGGSAPTEGNPSSIDAYVLSIIKTGSATFTVLGSQTQFA